MISGMILHLIGLAMMLSFGKALDDNHAYAEGIAQSSASNPSGGPINLSNSAQASYNPDFGFVATSNTGNTVNGSTAVITSQAAADVVTGVRLISSEWHVTGSDHHASSDESPTSGVVHHRHSASSSVNEAPHESGSPKGGSGVKNTSLGQFSSADATVIARPVLGVNETEPRRSSEASNHVSTAALAPYAQVITSDAVTNADGTVNLTSVFQENFRYSWRSTAISLTLKIHLSRIQASAAISSDNDPVQISISATAQESGTAVNPSVKQILFKSVDPNDPNRSPSTRTDATDDQTDGLLDGRRIFVILNGANRELQATDTDLSDGDAKEETSAVRLQNKTRQSASKLATSSQATPEHR